MIPKHQRRLNLPEIDFLSWRRSQNRNVTREEASFCPRDGLVYKYKPALNPAVPLTSYPMTFGVWRRGALVSGEARAPFDSFMCGEL